MLPTVPSLTIVGAAGWLGCDRRILHVHRSSGPGVWWRDGGLVSCGKANMQKGGKANSDNASMTQIEHICLARLAHGWSRARRWAGHQGLAWARWVAVLATLVCGAAHAQHFLPVEQAFEVQASRLDDQTVALRYHLAAGVYLYRERMSATLTPPAGPAQSLTLPLPRGDIKHDPNFERDLEVYHHDVVVALRLGVEPGAGARGAVLDLGYQGCAEAGLCYPPQHRQFALQWAANGALVGVGDVNASPQGSPGATAAGAAAVAAVSPALASQSVPPEEGPSDGGDSRIGAALRSGHIWQVVAVFFAAGLLLSLTPCVLPMVPILSSIILGQVQAPGSAAAGRRAKGFGLALSYSQGMALVYTALGVAAGWLGQGLAAYLQHPWVVLGFAVLMVGLALSMFGLYTLQLPSAVQTWLGQGSQALPGGQVISVFVMGAVSALVVSPCVSAPLAGALLYISQTHDVGLGGIALYALACGMGVPLLLVGVSAGGLLPRTGPWMVAVKGAFGVIMLGMAVWISRPAWPYVQTQILGQSLPQRQAHHGPLPFVAVHSSAELDAALRQASAQGRVVMLDFYADWCTACIQMERSTFTDPSVQRHLQAAVLLQADVTLNAPQDRALLKRFALFGPPGMVFFDAHGQELAAHRVVGEQSPVEFLHSLADVGL